MTKIEKQKLEDLLWERTALEEENKQLKETIKSLRAQLEAYQSQARKRARQDYDYLPYDDDDRR